MVSITKALAKKMYDNGEEIMIAPCNVKANDKFAEWITKPVDDPAATFEKMCDIIFFYNCNPKTGLELAFYAKEV